MIANRRMPEKSPTYAAAGVDIEAGDAVARAAARAAAGGAATIASQGGALLAGIGGFGAQIALPRLKNPVAVLAADGVGTKLEIARQADAADGLGIDLVAMCANDAICCGARPFAFLDYYACGKLDPAFATRLLDSIARGCEIAGCALVGGETAEMPGSYPPSGFDLAGFMLALCEAEDVLRPQIETRPGDAVLGLASTGAHSNGYSLIRAILARAEIGLDARVDGAPLAELLLAPTRIYVRAVAALFAAARPRALCHVTGGGLESNLARVLPPACAARIDFDSWPRPPLFDFLRRAGGVAEEEMRRVFNLGVGMVVVVAADRIDDSLVALRAAGETAFVIGEIVAAPVLK